MEAQSSPTKNSEESKNPEINSSKTPETPTLSLEKQVDLQSPSTTMNQNMVHRPTQSQQPLLNREENDVLNRMIQWVEVLRTKDEIDQIKTKVLFEIIDGFQSLKNLNSSDEHKKTIKKVLKRLFMKREIFAKFRKLLLLRERDRSLRETCIRVLKKILKVSKKLAPIMKLEKIHVVIGFFIEREFKSATVAKERYQGVKFINAWQEKSPQTFPLIFGQILVSIAKNIEDTQLRRKAIEQLLTMCVQCPEVSANVGAMRLIIECLLDMSLQGIRYDLISSTILILLNDPKTRKYFRHFQDLNRIFSIFTTVDGVSKEPKKDILEKIQQQMSLASKSIVNIMRNWNGVIYMTSSPLGLESLINSLTQPIHMYKKLAILDTFVDIFNIPIYIASTDISSFGSSSMCLSSNIVNFNENLLNNYVGLLLQAFYYCGIYDALIKLATTTEEGSEINKKSKFLLKKIMYLSSYLLPEVPHFPSLIKIASDFTPENQFIRTRATKMIKELSTISLRNPLEMSKNNEIFGGSSQQTIKDFSKFFMNVYEYFNSMQLGLPITTVISNYLVDLKTYYYSEIDDQKFNFKIKQSQVLQQKDFRKWNWVVINEILEGNLLTPARLEEVMKKTKFIKRILNFFMPSKQNFINMEWKEENLSFARAGYNLIKTLLASKEGQKALSSSPGVFFMFGLTFVENKDNIFHHRKSFLQEICDLLEREVYYLVQSRANYGKKKRRNQTSQPANAPQTTPGNQATRSTNVNATPHFQTQHPQSTPGQGQAVSAQSNTNQAAGGVPVQPSIGATDDQRYFTKKRLTQTMLREYLSWLGLFTTTKDGIKLLKKFKIFDHLMQIVDPNGYYDHFCQIILQSFDYGFASSTRKMLEVWITKCSPNLAKSIIELFRMLFRSGLNDFYYWCLPFLNKLIGYGNLEEIAAAAFDVLEEVCFDQNSLNQLLVINDKILDSLKNSDQQSDLFITKFLRSQRGFQILKQDGWLQAKMEEWKVRDGQEYIIRLEKNLYDGLNMNQMNSQLQNHAMTIWIPIYEHSSDFRNELMILKRYPFQIQIKVESLSNEVIAQETLQTYIEADADNQLQIVGKIVNKHSKLYGVPIENFYYISVCMRLGACYVDTKGERCESPFWTITDVNDKNKSYPPGYGGKNGSRFRIFKNGIHFNFQKGQPSDSPSLMSSQAGNDSQNFNFDRQTSVTGSMVQQVSAETIKIFLDSVVYKVQILPQKYKIIKTPVHLFGELVKTDEGAQFLKQSNDIEFFKKEILDPETPLVRKRAALWTIGHIGGSEQGFKLIQQANIVKEVVNIAERAEILSLRGTSIYILGLLCTTEEGRREVHKHNWISSMSQGVSVCLPRDPQVLFKVTECTYQGDLAQRGEIWDRVAKLNETIQLTKEESEITTLIGNLINGVTEIKALEELRNLLQKQKQIFLNPKIFEHVLVLLSIYRFKPKARKFIFNMFEDLIFSDKMIIDGTCFDF